jgi:hypothetical protein
MLVKRGEPMGANSLNERSITPSMDGSGNGGEGVRPTANYDEEEGPDERARVVEAIRRVRYGTAGTNAYRGVFPGQEGKTVHRRIDIDIAPPVGGLALEAFIIGEQSPN